MLLIARITFAMHSTASHRIAYRALNVVEISIMRCFINVRAKLWQN